MPPETLYDDPLERELFLMAVAAGTPPDLAGIEVSWTPRRTRLNLADPDFAEMVRMAQDRSLDSIELALYKLATEGKNLGAMQMILYNKRPVEWKDVRRIEVNQHTTISIGAVAATIEAAKALMREVGPAALQPGGALDIIDAESTEET